MLSNLIQIQIDVLLSLEPFYQIKNQQNLTTAQSVYVIDLNINKVIFSKNQTNQTQIASLTKIMTFLTSLLILQKYNKLFDTVIRVTDYAASMVGTTANLKSGDLISFQNLLYAMMLPSGNDASVSLAQYCGRLIAKSKSNQKYKFLQGKQTKKRFPYIQSFVNQMNRIAKQIGLSDTLFDCPHGLSNQLNYSTAQNIAKLSAISLQIPIFKKIVSTRTHNCKIYNDRSGLNRNQLWINSNKLLHQFGYFGIKTGVTPTAGPCFTGYFQTRQTRLLVVLIKTQNCHQRFKETHKLVLNILQRRGQKYPYQIEWKRKINKMVQ